MKKRAIGFFLVIALLSVVILAGCNSQATSSKADTYIELANEYLNTGDYNSAIEILQKGYKATEDERLAIMLADILQQDSTMTVEESEINSSTLTLTNESSSAETTEFSEYTGTWAQDEIGWQYGGLILDIAVTVDSLSIEVTYTQSAPSSRVANFIFEVPISSIQENTLEHTFENDGWDNAGTIILTFSSDKIVCEVKDTHYVGSNGFPIWGISEGTMSVVPNETAHDALVYEMEDYYNLNPEADPNYEATPVYDMTKASGILAAAGLTEHEFKDICTPLGNMWVNLYDCIDKELSYINKYHLAYGQQYFLDHPEDDSVIKATEEWNDICADYQSGGRKFLSSKYYYYNNSVNSDYHLYEKYGSLENFLNDTVYAPKGMRILTDNAKAIFNDMMEYPNNYLGSPFVINGCRLSASSSSVYTELYTGGEIQIRDLRDDPHNPNIISGTDYYLYVTFDGTYVDSDGDIGFLFSLLSLEKYE